MLLKFFSVVSSMQHKMLNYYPQILYLDGDYFPLTSLDSLFDTIQPGKICASYCSKPGIVDPCFNAGQLLLLPWCHSNHGYHGYRGNHAAIFTITYL